MSKMQEAFEKEHCGNNPHTTRRNEHGDYVLPWVQDAWSGFQTGYQAAIADVKAGGAHQYFLKSGGVSPKVYELPEDV